MICIWVGYASQIFFVYSGYVFLEELYEKPQPT